LPLSFPNGGSKAQNGRFGCKIALGITQLICN